MGTYKWVSRPEYQFYFQTPLSARSETLYLAHGKAILELLNSKNRQCCDATR